MSKKLIILHDSVEWLKPIKKSLDKLDINYEDVLMGEGQIDLAKEPEDAIYFNRVSPSSYLRGLPYSIEHAVAYLSYLNSYGRAIINNVETQYLEISKVLQYVSMEKYGIKTPRTVAVAGKKNILSALDCFDYPLIIKTNRGGSGDGVEIFYSEEEVAHYVAREEVSSFDNIFLVQQYIKPKDGVIYRAEFIGGEYVATIKITVSDDFNLCPADACNISMKACPIGETQEDKFVILRDYKPQFLDNYLQFLKEKKYDIAGIEFVISEDGDVYTYDVNSNTNYNSDAEEKAGFSIYDTLAQYLQSQLVCNS